MSQKSIRKVNVYNTFVNSDRYHKFTYQTSQTNFHNNTTFSIFPDATKFHIVATVLIKLPNRYI